MFGNVVLINKISIEHKVQIFSKLHLFSNLPLPSHRLKKLPSRKWKQDEWGIRIFSRSFHIIPCVLFYFRRRYMYKMFSEWETKYIIWYLFIIQNETHIFWLLEIEPKDLYSILSDPPTFLSIFARCRLRYVYDQIKGAWINWQKMINLM